jgi:DNA-binding transcriptional LysR family regulator
LPKYIAKFKTFYPNTDIKLVSGNTQDIISMVELINCDVGFVEGKCDSTSIDVTPWKKDFLNIICNSNHKLIGKKDISVSDIIKYEWAIREIGSGTSDALLDALSTKYYSKLKTSIILNNSEAIKQYVINSQSLACLSESILKQDNGNNEYQILDVINLSVERSFYKLMHNSKYHSNLTTVFCKFVSEQDN